MKQQPVQQDRTSMDYFCSITLLKRNTFNQYMFYFLTNRIILYFRKQLKGTSGRVWEDENTSLLWLISACATRPVCGRGHLQ